MALSEEIKNLVREKVKSVGKEGRSLADKIADIQTKIDALEKQKDEIYAQIEALDSTITTLKTDIGEKLDVSDSIIPNIPAKSRASLR